MAVTLLQIHTSSRHLCNIRDEVTGLLRVKQEEKWRVKIVTHQHPFPLWALKGVRHLPIKSAENVFMPMQSQLVSTALANADLNC